MSNGDDESDAGEGSAGTEETSAEKAGTAESELDSDEDNPTAREIAADEDGTDEGDEPAGEADEEARLEADQMGAERADEESTSGDDVEIGAPDEAAAERDETENETPDGSEDDEPPEGDADDEGGDESEAEDAGTSEDADEADTTEEASPGDEEPETTESDAEGDEDHETEDTESGASDSDETSESGSDEAVDEDAESDELETKHTPESLDERLDDIEARIDEAETEADLDAVEADLDDVEADIEAADLPEPDEDEDDGDDDDEEAERTRDELESRVTELREAIEAQRGPYAEDVVETVDSAETTITGTRWTDQGEHEMSDAVDRFLDAAGDALDETFTVDRSHESDLDEDEVATDGGDETADDDHGALVAALDDVIDTIEARDLDPDEDEGTIAGLIEAADGLADDLDDAEEWDDLTVREKLTVEGFYDVLSAENRKDFPPEWNAIKIYEKRGEPEPILRGLEMFGSDFMEKHCLESLKRLGAPEAFDAMEQRAQKRADLPIAALGKIGDDRALDTLHEYIEGESDPGLQKVTLKAIGEIGSQDSTQPVADRLVADNETVRSNAARALGLIGDARAIDPLADVLREDDSNSVRASAAWALNQIGTESALDAARDHADDRSYLVQSEAEKAEHAMTDDGDAAETPA